MAVYYCKQHPSFEGLNMGHAIDHAERDHPNVQSKQQIAEYWKTMIVMEDFRRSDGKFLARTWGRPPRLANTLGIVEEKK